MILESGLAAIVVIAGRFLDQYATESLNDRVRSWIHETRIAGWKDAVSSAVYNTYVKIFDRRGTTIRFILRSVLAYCVILIFSYLFLYLFFPQTYVPVSSVWTDGSSYEKLFWTFTVLLGSLLYILANAQTLYFLEILKTAPTTFRFFLVAYADLLITASIALFGISGLLTLYGYLCASSSETALPVKVDFSHLVRNADTDVYYGIVAKSDPKLALEIAKESKKPGLVWLEAQIEPAGTSRAAQRYAADFDLAVAFIKMGIEQGRYDPKRQIIQLPDSTGVTENYIPRTRSVDETASVLITDQNPNLDAEIAKFCDTLRQSPNDPTYVIVTLSETDKNSISSACKGWKSAQISPLVKFNMNNVNWGTIYLQYVYLDVNTMITSITSGFNSYLCVSPYTLLSDVDQNAFKHSHRLGERQDGSQALDRAMLKNLAFELGGLNWYTNRALPAGSIHFAIFSTCALNFLTMLCVFLLYPLLALAERQSLIKQYVNVDKHPFFMISVAIAGWIIALTFIASLI